MGLIGWRPAAGIALVLVAGVGGSFSWFRSSTLPALDGSIALPGLQKAVVIEREPSGVVHIRAQTDHDLFFAQGVIQVQDRLWQMEFQRRIGAGRLAEILGPRAVDQDRYLRTWGFYRAAQAAYAHLSPEARGVIDAYVEGINAYLASRPPLPPELRLLGVTPAPWTSTDVLVWTKMMAYNLADDRRAELRRFRLLARGLVPARIQTLMPLYPGEHASNAGHALVRPEPAAERLAAALLVQDGDNRQHLSRASNNWVVHGSHTVSGRPLLANDVHLGMQLPSTWYLMHLRSPGFDVIGATLPGLPLVVIGRNRDIAWGVTNLAADVEDLYVIDTQDGGYLYKGKVRPFDSREEVIRVKGEADVHVRVRSTVQGPVISDVVSDAAGAATLALRWVGNDPDDTTADAFLGINRARSWPEFLTALDRYVAPGQNFVFADTQGHIGYSASGRIPLRRPGHSGLYPVSGDGRWDWLGYIPPSQLPRRFDPASGFVATANNRITQPGYPYELSLEWGDEPYRFERIRQLLQAGARQDRRSMRAMQQDMVTLLYFELRPMLDKLQPRSGPARRWRDRLLTWDGDCTADSAEATVFQAWYTELTTLPTKETGTVYWNYPRYLLHALREGDPACTARGMSCLEFAARALDKAVDRVGGSPPAWGVLHHAHLAHALLTHTLLAHLTDRSVPFGGGRYTVDVGSYSPDDWSMFHGPSYRQVIDLAQPEKSVFVLAGGQSGNWLSAQYADELPLWQKGGYLPMRRLGYHVAHTLTLVPAKPLSKR
jgi:penicillin amidase